MTALHHLAFRVADVDRMTRFYCEVLGAEVARRKAHAAWLGLAGVVLMLEERDAREPAPDPASLELTCFAATPDERAAIEGRLIATGAAVEARTDHTIYFRDPEGRRLGASTYPF